MKKLKIKVTETKNKAGVFLYEVIGEDGSVIATRRSNRTYVACYVYGNAQEGYTTQYWFGRYDLVDKGDSARYNARAHAYALADINA
jgi:hypothetical protein